MNIINTLSKIKRKILSPTVKITIVTSASNNNLKNEVILITGGATGIGKATAQAAIDQGAEIIIMGRREKLLRSVCEELGNDYCKYMVCDINDIIDYASIWIKLEKLYGKNVTAIICNAGVYMDKSPFDFDENDFDQCMSTNLKAPFFMMQQYVKYCVEKDIHGNIIVTASNRGLIGDYGPYGISKAGIINYVQGMAREYVLNGIRVNAVAPGMTASEINQIDISGDMYNGLVRGKRVLVPQEIAEVICFLLSKKSRCITGAVIPCDEGERLR